MKTRQSLMGLKSKGGLLLLMALGSLTMSVNTYATSAGSILRNSVTVDYDDAGGNAMTQETASVDVTVDLVGSVAWGAEPTGQTVSSGDVLASPFYEITLTNTGNGSDTYDITQGVVTGSCTLTGTLSDQDFSLTSSETLGATVSADGGVENVDETSISVSNMDGELAVGNIVLIGSNTYRIKTVTLAPSNDLPDTLVVEEDPANPGTGGLAVTAGDIAAAGNPAGYGVQIGEQITVVFGATGNAGSTTSGASVCTHPHVLTAESSLTPAPGNTAAIDTTASWSTTVESVKLSVAKYVRNVDEAAKNRPIQPLPDISYDNEDYFLSGVTGNPGDTLEYLVVITSDSATTDAENVIFADTLPTFTTYNTSSIAVDTDGDGGFDVTLPTDETEIDGTGIVTQAGQNITVYAGTGGDEATATGGVVAGGDVTAIKYSVEID